MDLTFGPTAVLHTVTAHAGTLGLGALVVGGRLLGTAGLVVLSLDGQGGQAKARRNAWASMSDAHQGSLDRREAEAALAAGLALSSGHPAGSGRRLLGEAPPLAR